MRLLLLALISHLVIGCANQPHQPVYADESLLLLEPRETSFKREKELAQINELLSRVELADDKKAIVLYQRGIFFDSLGLRGLSRLDFIRALNLKPDIADAYNYLGVHATLSQDFELAFEHFDSTIELQPEHQFAYLNRGIALYYSDRRNLAIEDFQQFLAFDPNDPYRMLWSFIGESAVNYQQALTTLQANQSQLQPGNWGNILVKLFLGKITDDILLASIQKSNISPEIRAERLCEAYFYMAKLKQLQHQPSIASQYFKLALTTNVFEFVEHKYARLELKLMQEASIYTVHAS